MGCCVVFFFCCVKCQIWGIATRPCVGSLLYCYLYLRLYLNHGFYDISFSSPPFFFFFNLLLLHGIDWLPSQVVVADTETKTCTSSWISFWDEMVLINTSSVNIYIYIYKVVCGIHLWSALFVRLFGPHIAVYKILIFLFKILIFYIYF
jgi:hypothetical protein